MLQNIEIELGRCIVLRIPAKDLLLLPRGVGQIYKITNHITEAGRVKQSLDHGIERVDPVFFDQVAAVRLPPGVEEFIGREKRPRLIVHPVADHAKRIVFKQFRDVALVAHRQLNKGIVNRRILADRALEFKHHQRQSIDVENTIRYPLLVTIYIQLVNYLENVQTCAVGFRVLCHDHRHLTRLRFPKRNQVRIIDQLHIEVFPVAVFTLEQKPIRDQLHDRLITLVEIIR